MTLNVAHRPSAFTSRPLMESPQKAGAAQQFAGSHPIAEPTTSPADLLSFQNLRSSQTELAGQIERFLQGNQAQPLFYTEGGSRLYKTHHAHSDYDIRGLHIGNASPKGHLGLQQGLLDVSSYELGRFFALLGQNNPNCIEWIQNTAHYIDRFPERKELLPILESCFDPQALRAHYLKLSKNQLDKLKKGKLLDYKTTFHVVRALFTANVITATQLPPTHFNTLLVGNPDLPKLQYLGQLCLDQKKQNLGKEFVRNPQELSSMLEAAWEQVQQKPLASNPRASQLTEQLETLLQKITSRVSIIHP